MRSRKRALLQQIRFGKKRAVRKRVGKRSATVGLGRNLGQETGLNGRVAKGRVEAVRRMEKTN